MVSLFSSALYIPYVTTQRSVEASFERTVIRLCKSVCPRSRGTDRTESKALYKEQGEQDAR
jgi:hypothetical protein